MDKREYVVHNDGYGYLTAEFPNTYPPQYLEQPPTDTVLKQKIDAIMKTLTLDKKIGLLSADGMMGHDTSAMDIEKSYGTGYWAGAARVGVPVMRCYDGPMGVRGNSGFETTRPSSEVSVACSFDPKTAYEYGKLYALDNRASAGNMQLGIQTDLIRTLSTSRARDMFGEDWFLEGKIGSAMAKGLEDHHVLACLKHCGGMGNIDEQTMMENQLSIYEDILKTDKSAHAVMTNYGSSNGQQACADSYVLKKVLRELWGWKGIALTDWGGNYQFTVDKGITMETPSNTYNNHENIYAALNGGRLTEEEINEAVSNNLYAMGKIGYLGLVQISRDGTAAVDPTPISAIEMDEVMDPAQREKLLEENSEAALKIAQAGIVLLKNEKQTLPLGARDENIALVGFGAMNTIAGHMHECAFGRLKDLAISPYDALSKKISGVKGYAAQDELGEAIPAEYLFQDEAATIPGVKREGTDGDGNAVSTVDAQIDFVTNSTDYKNAENGTAFPYGTQGANYTWSTWLHAPETGTYTLKIEGMAASEISGTITVDGKAAEIGAAGGSIGSGFFGMTGIVTSKTGLDIPKKPKPFENPFGGIMPPNMEGGPGTPMPPMPFMRPAGEVEFHLEGGESYRITVTANGNVSDAYDYQRGKKDMQVRLAWVTPTQRTENYAAAIRAAGEAGTTVVLFAHELEHLHLEEVQQQLLDDAIRAAKATGNRIVLVLSTALPVDISKWEKHCDAIVAAWLPGQTGGTAIANVLSGTYNPTGRLCVTWPRDFSADQSELNSNGRGVLQAAGHPGANVPTEIKEGIFNGYKWYDAMGKDSAVLFDFGHGLSYTDFSYELEEIVPAVAGMDTYGYDVRVKVTNSGSQVGADVVQLYLAAPKSSQVPGAIYSPERVAESFRYVDADGNPTEDYASAQYFPQIDGVQFAARQLCGFAQTGLLAPGMCKTVTIHISQRMLSYWDAAQTEYTVRGDGTKDKWTVVEGTRTLELAKASDCIVLETEIDVKPVVVEKRLRVSAPQTVGAGERFVVDVVTSSKIIGVRLLGEDNRPLPLADLEVVFEDTQTKWKLPVKLDAEGATVLSVQVKTWDGWEQPAANFQVQVLRRPAEVLSAEFTKHVARLGQQVTATVQTVGEVTSLQVTDEFGTAVPFEVLCKEERDGMLWTLAISPAHAEIGQIFSFAAVGEDGSLGSTAARTVLSVLD